MKVLLVEDSKEIETQLRSALHAIPQAEGRQPAAEYARLAGADASCDKSLELERFVQLCQSQSQSRAKHQPVRPS